MEPPQQIDAKTPGDYLEVLTKAVFESGMSWRVVEAKWPGFREAFHGFDAGRIAALTPDEIDALTNDTRIIRNRRKIEATVHNAQAMLDLEREFGSVGAYLGSHGGFFETLKAMKKRFKHVGDFGCYYFLYVVKQPTPEHHEFREKLLEGATKK